MGIKIVFAVGLLWLKWKRFQSHSLSLCLCLPVFSVPFEMCAFLRTSCVCKSKQERKESSLPMRIFCSPISLVSMLLQMDRIFANVHLRAQIWIFILFCFVAQLNAPFPFRFAIVPRSALCIRIAFVCRVYIEPIHSVRYIVLAPFLIDIFWYVAWKLMFRTVIKIKPKAKSRMGWYEMEDSYDSYDSYCWFVTVTWNNVQHKWSEQSKK